MYCKKCGQQISDQSRFCRYCGASVTPSATAEPEAPISSEISGTVPVIPDLSPESPATAEASPVQPTVPETGTPVIPDVEKTTSPVYEPEDIYIPEAYAAAFADSVGSYEDIMAEFSSGTPLYQPEPAPKTASMAQQAQEDEEHDSGKRGILIAISVVLLLALLVGAVVLCVKVLIPDPQEDPILQEEVIEPSTEESIQPSPSPSVEAVIAPEPSSVVYPQISPPGTDAEVTPAPSAPTSPAATATPAPSHNAASGNTTVVGTKYVDYVATSANFRSAPEQSDSNIITTIPLGTRVDFIEEYNTIYSKVKYDGTYGYIATEYLADSKPNLTVSGTAYVTNVDLCAYFRSTPAQDDSNVISYVYLDQELDYIETQGDYVRVKVDGRYGYVHKDYISFNAPSSTVTKDMYVTGVKNGAYFLQYPRQGTNVLDTLAPGTQVGYIGDSENGYCKVSYNDQIGYILGEYLTETSPAEEENLAAQEELLEYALDQGFAYYSFLDINGDGIDELLASKDHQRFQDMWVSSSATLFVHEDGNVVEKGLLNENGGDAPMLYTALEGGGYQVVTEYSGQGIYVCTFYHLDTDGSLAYEAWSLEAVDGVNVYYVNRNGTKEETTQAEHDAAVTSPGYYYVIFEAPEA